MNERELLSRLIDQCYDRDFNIPYTITDYLVERYQELEDSITIQIPLNVCKCTSEDNHEFDRNKT